MLFAILRRGRADQEEACYEQTHRLRRTSDQLSQFSNLRPRFTKPDRFRPRTCVFGQAVASMQSWNEHNLVCILSGGRTQW